MNTDNSLAVQYKIQAENPLPTALVIVLVVAILMLIFWLYHRERGKSGRVLRVGLASLRCMSLFLVLWMLFAYGQQRYSIAKPILAIIVDSSDSMDTQDEGQGVSRYAESVTALKSIPRSVRRTLDRGYDTRWFRMANRAEDVRVDWQDLTPLENDRGQATDQSRIGDSITQIVRSYGGGALAGIVLLSDGVNTGGRTLEAAARDAKNYGVPISAIAVGRGQPAPDARIVELLNDRELYAGDDAVVTVNLAINSSDVTAAKLRLIDESTNRLVDQVDAQLIDGNAVAKLKLSAPAVGVHPLRVELDPLEGEENLTNNQARTTVNVSDSTIKVLMVFERPSYEFRFLKHWLERSVGANRKSPFELDCVLQSAEGAYVQQDDSAIRLVPTSQEDLATYDAFIFGDCRLELISRGTQQRIVRSVSEDGAGCIFVFGQQEPTRSWAGEPLSQLLPVAASTLGMSDDPEQGPFSWEITRSGAALLPALDQSGGQRLRLPLIDSLSNAGQLKAGAQVVAEAASVNRRVPLVLAQFSGAGRVFTQLTDESFRLVSQFGDDEKYQKYWLNVLRWCTRGRLTTQRGFELVVSPKQLRLGNAVSVVVRLSSLPSQAPVVLARSADGSSSSIAVAPSPDAPLQYVGTFEPESVGQFQIEASVDASLEKQTKNIEVMASNVEQDELLADRTKLAKLAELSGGGFYELDRLDEALRRLPTGRSVRLGALPAKPIWNHWLAAGILVFLLCIEWGARKRVRML